MEAGTLGLLLLGLGMLPATAPACSECDGSGCSECQPTALVGTDAELQMACNQTDQVLLNQSYIQPAVAAAGLDHDEHDRLAIERFTDEGGN